MKFCTLSSSSYANSVVIQDDNTCIMIDCGLKKRDIKPYLSSIGLSPGDIDAVLVTHCHIDHSYGLNYITAEKEIPIYSTAGVLMELTRDYRFKKEPHLMVMQDQVVENINSLQVTPLKLSHDVQTIGFLICSGNQTLGFMTDTGFVPESCLQAFQSVDFLYIESNHDVEMYQSSKKPYFVKKRNLGPTGHLSNAQCGEALKTMGLNNCKLVVLAHLSEDDNEPQIALNNAKGYLMDGITLTAAPSRVPGEWSDLIIKSGTRG